MLHRLTIWAAKPASDQQIVLAFGVVLPAGMLLGLAFAYWLSA
jgi:hypothetical protein